MVQLALILIELISELGKLFYIMVFDELVSICVNDTIIIPVFINWFIREQVAVLLFLFYVLLLLVKWFLVYWFVREQVAVS